MQMPFRTHLSIPVSGSNGSECDVSDQSTAWNIWSDFDLMFLIIQFYLRNQWRPNYIKSFVFQKLSLAFFVAEMSLVSSRDEDDQLDFSSRISSHQIDCTEEYTRPIRGAVSGMAATVWAAEIKVTWLNTTINLWTELPVTRRRSFFSVQQRDRQADFRPRRWRPAER